MVTSDQRLKDARDFLRSVDEVAQRFLTDSIVLQLWAFLQNYCCLAVPEAAEGNRINFQQTGYPYGFKGRVDPVLHIIPLYAEDQGKFGAVIDKLWMVPGVAMYVPFIHTIFIRPEEREASPITASAGFHEIYHAFLAVQEKRAGVSDTRPLSHHIFLEEVDTHSLEHRIRYFLGGTAYQQALLRGMDYVYGELYRQREFAGNVLIGLPGYPAELDRAFGPAPSVQARNDRKLGLDFHANFAVIDDSKLPSAKRAKADLLAAYYAANKVDPRF